jgi:hypothetical protein
LSFFFPGLFIGFGPGWGIHYRWWLDRFRGWRHSGCAVFSCCLFAVS